MMISAQTHPFYKKFALILFIIIALGFLCWIGQGIISPLIMAVLFAILLRPVAVFLNERLRLPNVLASLITILIFMFFIIAVFYFISTQVASMADDWEKIKGNLLLHYQHLQSYVSDTFAITKKQQDKMVTDATHNSESTGKQIIGSTLLSFTDSLMNLILIPIYMFLILLYRTHFAKFLSLLFPEKHHSTLRDILSTIKISVQGYILGLLFELLIVSGLTSVGLLILGVKYAILLGVITGILNLIPYLGILIALFITLVASLTGSSEISVMLGIVVVNVVVQIIDNNILVPLVVSSKVEINSIASIAGIIIGGALAGLSGMFLAIPIMAILKVIFDRVDGLQPWGYLLGDDLPKSFKWKKSRMVKATETVE